MGRYKLKIWWLYQFNYRGVCILEVLKVDKYCSISHWDLEKCPYYGGVLITEVPQYTMQLGFEKEPPGGEGDVSTAQGWLWPWALWLCSLAPLVHSILASASPSKAPRQSDVILENAQLPTNPFRQQELIVSIHLHLHESDCCLPIEGNVQVHASWNDFQSKVWGTFVSLAASLSTAVSIFHCSAIIIYVLLAFRGWGDHSLKQT